VGPAAKLGAEIRQGFLNDFGTAHCATLRKRFGEERQMVECRKLVKKATEALLLLITEDPSKYEAPCCDCTADQDFAKNCGVDTDLSGFSEKERSVLGF
jgi:hypothetical protein